MAAGTKLKAGLFVEWVVFQGDFSLGPGFFFDLPGNGSANIAHGIGGGGGGVTGSFPGQTKPSACHGVLATGLFRGCLFRR